MPDKSKRAKTSVPPAQDHETPESSEQAPKPASKPKTAAKKPAKAPSTKADPSAAASSPEEKPKKKKAPAKKAAEAKETKEGKPAAKKPKATKKASAGEPSAIPAQPGEAPAIQVKAAEAAPLTETPSVAAIVEAPSSPAALLEPASVDVPLSAPTVPASTPSKRRATKKRATKTTASARAASLPLKHYDFIGVPSFKGQTIEPSAGVPAPPPPAPKELTLEERLEVLQVRLSQRSEASRKQIQDQLDMSWIYHDSALEGVVYSFNELKTALGPEQTLIQESSQQPVIEEIRRHREAIELVRDAAKKKAPITGDLVKKLYLTLHPEEGDLKTVKFRKDIPQHRLYFHEYAQPDKIAGKVRQVIDWLNEPEMRKGRNALRVAARAHYDLLRAFPFPTDSGKVARLLMNLLLLQAGYEPAIVHSTERQRYYDALKGSAQTIISMVLEAEENAVLSLERLLDEQDSRGRSAG